MVTPDKSINAADSGRGLCVPLNNQISIYPIRYASGTHVFFTKESAEKQCVNFHIDDIDAVIERLVQIRDGAKHG